MIAEIRNNRWEVEFESVAEVAKVGRSCRTGGCHHVEEGVTWVNMATHERISRWLADGNEATSSAVGRLRDSLIEKIDVPTKQRRKVRHRLDDGDELDPEAVAVRDPDGWSRTEREPRDKTCVRIAVNLAVASGRRPQDLLWRGAAAAATADILTGMGLSVEVTGFSCTTRVTVATGRSVLMSVPVKTAEQPLDLATMAVALSEIGFYRLAFLLAKVVAVGERLTVGLGFPTLLPAEYRRGFDLVIDSDVFTREQAEAAVLTAVNAWRNK